jgi:large subunit ribosomal protein L15
MRLHDLRPPDGSRTPRTRVGRGIAAGKGKTAGRGTKGQKARAGGSIPPWFEGGQTPLHMRIPKLRGFKNRFRIEYEVVNIGAIAAAVDRGAFEAPTGGKAARGKSRAADQVTVNQDLLRAVGLVRTLDKPLKILGGGELSSPLFVVADAFTASARSKIEAAGGTVSVLEVPTKAMPALGVDATAEVAAPEAGEPAAEAPSEPAVARAKPKSPRTSKASAKAEVRPADAEAVAAEAALADAGPDQAAPADADAQAEPAEAEAEPAEAEAEPAEADPDATTRDDA